MKILNTIIFLTDVEEKVIALMKAMTITLILFLTTTHLNLLAQNEINFIKLNESIGIVIDSLENEQCKCLPNQNSETFRHAFIIQRPDSFIVLHVIHKGSITYKKEFLTPVSIKSIYDQSEIHATKIKPYYNTTSENQIAQDFAGNANISNLTYKEIYFVDYLTKSQKRSDYNSTNMSVVTSTNTNTTYVNLSGGYALPSSSSVDIGINLILTKNTGFSISSTAAGKKAKHLPSDYYGGLILFGGSNDPQDYIEHYSIRITKNFRSSSKLMRFGIEGGVSVVNNRIAQFSKVGNQGLFQQNYDVTYDNNYSAGLSTKAKVEFPLTTWIGFEISTIINLNEYQSYGGLQFGLLIGRVRYR